MKTIKEQLEDIGDHAIRKLDKKQVSDRLEKSIKDKKEKDNRMQQLKDGRAFIVENADHITIYKFISHEDNIGIAIGCHDLDGEGRNFNLACSHCSQGDMKRNKWSDRIARGIIGAELKKEWDKSNGLKSMLFFEKKTDPINTINYLFILKMSDIAIDSSAFKNITFQYRVGGPFVNLVSSKVDCGRSFKKQAAAVVPVDEFKCSICKYVDKQTGLCSVGTIYDLSSTMRKTIEDNAKYYHSLNSIFVSVPDINMFHIFACPGKVENFIDLGYKVEFTELPHCDDCKHRSHVHGCCYNPSSSLSNPTGCCIKFEPEEINSHEIRKHYKIVSKDGLFRGISLYGKDELSVLQKQGFYIYPVSSNESSWVSSEDGARIPMEKDPSDFKYYVGISNKDSSRDGFVEMAELDALIKNGYAIRFKEYPKCLNCKYMNVDGVKCNRCGSIPSIDGHCIDFDKKDEVILDHYKEFLQLEKDIVTKPLVHEKLYCTRCNVLNSIDSIFCKQCGSRILQEE